METNNNTIEMNLTDREIKLIAFEGEGVNTYNPNFMDELSNRVQGLIYKSGVDFGYVVRRCLFLTNKK